MVESKEMEYQPSIDRGTTLERLRQFSAEPVYSDRAFFERIADVFATVAEEVRRSETNMPEGTRPFIDIIDEVHLRNGNRHIILIYDDLSSPNGEPESVIDVGKKNNGEYEQEGSVTIRRTHQGDYQTFSYDADAISDDDLYSPLEVDRNWRTRLAYDLYLGFVNTPEGDVLNSYS